MEHLPHPSNPIRVMPRVPYLGGPNSIFRGYEYDASRMSEAWEKYPERAGWQPRTIREWYQCFENQQPRMASLLQTWLFFGFLEVQLGFELQSEELIERINGEDRVVSTTLLAKKGKFSTHGRSGQIYPIIVSLFKALGYFSLRRLGRGSTDHNKVVDLFFFLCEVDSCGLNPLPEIVLLSIHLLYDKAIVQLLEPDVRFPFLDLRLLEQFTGTSLYFLCHHPNLLERQMRGHGWCPLELAMLGEKFNTAVIHFLSYVERPGFGNTHRTEPITSRHGTIEESSVSSSGPLCSTVNCMIHQLDKSKYRTRHTSDCSNCEDVVADPEDIKRILEDGSFPLILSIGPDDVEEPSIELVAYEPDHSYVAISHVWSDGLGNLDRAALPTCQLRRLSRMVRNVLGIDSDNTILLFWLDTICCLPEDGHAQDLAISKMRQTYESATVVLVLDSWLWNQPSNATSDAETILKILVSGWNGRLWTLQEGALAKRLFFQFANGAYDLERGISMLEQMKVDHAHWMLRPSIQERLKDFRGFRHGNTDIKAKLAPLTRALEFRQTSVATDEALCLAALLDLPIEKIQKSAKESRMQEFWSLWPAIPLGLLFNWHGPRLSVEGFRWAPSTFLRNEVYAKWASRTRTLGFVDQAADRTRDGLRFSSRGLVLNKSKGNDESYRVGNHEWFIKDTDKNGQNCWYLASCHTEINPDSIEVSIDEGPGYYTDVGDGETPRPLSVLDPRIGLHLPGCYRKSGPRLIIIFQPPYRHQPSSFPDDDRQPGSHGILTSFRGGDSLSGFYLKFLSLVMLTKITPVNMHFFQHKIGPLSYDIDLNATVYGHYKTIRRIATDPEFESAMEKPVTWYVD